MDHFFLNLFQAHPDVWKHWGYGIIFAVALIESIPLLGMLIPGQIIIIFAGFLIRLKFFLFSYALIFTITGAIMGDLIGFIIGRYFANELPWGLRKLLKKEHVEKTKHLIEHHSFKTIFLGRLNSLTRTIAPFAAGTSNVTARSFVAADMLAAITWAALSLAAGYLFGKSFELAAGAIGKFMIIATLLVALIMIAVHYAKKHKWKISSTDTSILSTSASTLYLFCMIAAGHSTARIFQILNTRSIAFISHIRTSWLTYVMIFFTTLGSAIEMTILALTLTAWLSFKKRWSDALLVVTSMLGGVILVGLVKNSYQSARPLSMLIFTDGFSFPSGHAAMSMILAIIFGHIVLRRISNAPLRYSLYTLTYLAALCIGLSRVYLNVHWATDVLGGFFGGAFFATFMIALFKFTRLIIKRSKQRHELPNLP